MSVLGVVYSKAGSSVNHGICRQKYCQLAVDDLAVGVYTQVEYVSSLGGIARAALRACSQEGRQDGWVAFSSRRLRALHRRPLDRAGQWALRRRQPRHRNRARNGTRCERRPGPAGDRGSEVGVRHRPVARCLQQLSDALMARGEEIYALAQAEWGCSANERLIHVDGPAFMVGHAAELATEPAEAPMDAWGAAGTTLLRYEPLGVVAAMTPWNFPHTLNVMKLGAALAAGNT